jgi:hypothetical protein
MYLYLKLAKMPCFFFYKIGEQEGGTGPAGRGEKGEVAQIM